MVAWRLDFNIEDIVDGGVLTQLFAQLVGVGDDYAYERCSSPWGRHHGASPIRCVL
jgi:hypothetical protein